MVLDQPSLKELEDKVEQRRIDFEREEMKMNKGQNQMWDHDDYEQTDVDKSTKPSRTI